MDGVVVLMYRYRYRGDDGVAEISFSMWNGLHIFTFGLEGCRVESSMLYVTKLCFG